MAGYIVPVAMNFITHICSMWHVFVFVCEFVLLRLTKNFDLMLKLHWPVELLLLWYCESVRLIQSRSQIFDANQQRSHNLCLFVMLFDHHYLMNHPNANVTVYFDCLPAVHNNYVLLDFEFTSLLAIWRP